MSAATNAWSQQMCMLVRRRSRQRGPVSLPVTSTSIIRGMPAGKPDSPSERHCPDFVLALQDRPLFVDAGLMRRPARFRERIFGPAGQTQIQPILRSERRQAIAEVQFDGVILGEANPGTFGEIVHGEAIPAAQRLCHVAAAMIAGRHGENLLAEGDELLARRLSRRYEALLRIDAHARRENRRQPIEADRDRLSRPSARRF